MNKKKINKYRLIAIYIILTFYSLSFLKLSVSDLWFGMISLTWPYEEGFITDTALLEKSEKDETRWLPDVTYSYVVDEKQYHGNKISFSRSYFSKDSASDIIEGYNAGNKHNIYYSPSHPELSCIKPGLEKRVIFFSLLGLCGIIAVGFSVYRERKKAFISDKKLNN